MSQLRLHDVPEPMISYAQNHEDVLLARAFSNQPEGFYIDVGAWHPVRYSITKHFSDLGWRGINVEPNPQMHALLVRGRPNDVNLATALGRAPGRASLHVRADSSWSSLTPGSDPMDPVIDVQVETLAQVCERHAARRIDFLKIDVEGHERAVLEGADWNRFRPRIIVIEATRPGTSVPCFDEWEQLLLEARYHCVWFDGLNRFYVDDAERTLDRHFDRPPNVCDRFTSHDVVLLGHELRQREKEIAKLGQRIVEGERLNDQLRDSLSWRLTAPLRAVGTRIGFRAPAPPVPDGADPARPGPSSTG